MGDGKAGDPRDYVVEISGLAPQDETPSPGKTPPTPKAAEKPAESPDAVGHAGDWLAIQFRCCNAYARIYLTADGTAYAGHCPKCATPIRILIDPTSPNTGRFFTAG